MGPIKIKFLGTAAAEGWPAIFCRCESCRRARQLGGRNIRTRSSCVIDETYMVDFPPDTYMHVLTEHVDLSRVEHLLITHSHSDHFYPEDIGMRVEPYAHMGEVPALNVYGNDTVKKQWERTCAELPAENLPRFHEVQPFESYSVGQAEVVPLLADHTPEETCLLYLITRNGRTLLYGHDTGYFPEQTWEYLKNVRIDAALLDCTDGPGPCEHYHMGFPAVLNVQKRLKECRSATDDTLFVITHFSHNGRLLYEELVNMAEPYGFLVAYDGMELTV